MHNALVMDRFAERLKGAGLLIGPADQTPWINALEFDLGHRLPKTYGDFVRRYAFRPFEWEALSFFGNSEADDQLNLHVAARADPAIWRATRKARLLQFGRPATGIYDPICFDLRTSHHEPAIVQLDHEAILIKDRIRLVRQIAPGFVALAESLLASHNEPELIEP
jgi:hypothetical protein